ncbi:MAG: hypothetical protein KGL39_11685 [Patescibacteria group bacterium]|nr:hypothetical protein [Patescibacteria group bacterium]
MSAVTDLFGGSSSGPAPTQYNTWQPSNTSAMDTNYANLINSNLSTASNASPHWLSYLSQVTNNPYQAGAQTASNMAGTAYTNMGNTALSNANMLSGASGTTLNNAFDPLNTQYNLGRQANTDATNASLAARGLNTSGYGAGLANQSDINYNTNWQNNLLDRQDSGLNAAGSGYSKANTLGLSGAGAVNAGGQVPLSTYNTGVNTLGTGLSNYGTGATAVNNSTISSILPYLNLAASQSNAQGNFDQQYWQDMMNYTQTQNDLQNQQMAGIGNFIGSGLSAANTYMGANSPAWLAALAA